MQHKPRILCLDDEEEILEIIRFDLESAGYDVVAANSAQNALEIAKTTHFDYIISDVKMPRHDGQYFAKALREQGITTGMSFMSAFSDIDQEFMRNYKVDDIISKPYVPEKFIAFIKSKTKV